MARPVRKGMSQAQVLLMHGVRSGLEADVASALTLAGVEYEYEKLKLKYIVPASTHTYTPDFRLRQNGLIVETKGRFTAADRKKMLLVKQQHPDLDIRFVFTNSKTKIAKGSKTSYADWCEKHGFKYADKRIPEDWITNEHQAQIHQEGL